MKIRFNRSGGFANIQLAAMLDTGSMPTDEANAMERLVDAVDFFSLPDMISTGKAMPDAFSYTITIVTSDRQHTVKVLNEAPFASLQPLLDYLSKVAKKTSPKAGGKI